MSHGPTHPKELWLTDSGWRSLPPRATSMYRSWNRFREKDASMFEDDRSYYQRRAEVEIERAQLATVPSVVQAHYKLAEAYFSKLASDEPVKVKAS
jgi:hypothetical protein